MECFGFFRVACVSPEVSVASCAENAKIIIAYAKKSAKNGARVIIFPELSVTAYTCEDLFFQKTLLQSALENLEKIAFETKNLCAVILVGIPFLAQESSAIYNCCAALFEGKILALIPKTFLPNYSEFYEKRHFASAPQNPKNVFVSKKNPCVPFGNDILITQKNNPLFTLGIELCEDLWVPLSPSIRAVFNGATIIANLSAGNEIISKAEYRKSLVSVQSAKLCCAYAYANASSSESTTDAVFSGHSILCENGKILSESKLFSNGEIYADFDLEAILQERAKTTTFSDCRERFFSEFKLEKCRKIEIDFNQSDEKSNNKKPNFHLLRKISSKPFVPQDEKTLDSRCERVLDLQANALSKRLLHTKSCGVVLGLSGGLDSTLALLAVHRTFNLLGFKKSGITAVTMPGFGTTDRTYNNACLLAKELNANLLEIPIKNSVLLHFQDIGHDENLKNSVYENAQARERTQILLDLANEKNALMIGTGDLSELALGWCTYGGDQISMYNINASIPKTLVRYLVAHYAKNCEGSNKNAISKKCQEILRDILETPVSPELLPPDGQKIKQKTEELLGSYDLHDFFLYYTLRFGFSAEKILFLANEAFIFQNKKKGLPAEFSKKEIENRLKLFYQRFFSQQFKRSCAPDGAKIGTINLGPRSDLRMPSDALCNEWLKWKTE